MKLMAYWQKTFRENLREWKILILTLVFGPFFVYLMFAYFKAAAPAYTLLVLNEDQPAARPTGKPLEAGRELWAAWDKLTYPDGKPVFKTRAAVSLDQGRRLLKDREADLLVRIPPDFSRSLEAYGVDRSRPLAPVLNIGDESSVRFMVAASFADAVSYGYVASAVGLELPAAVSFEGAGSGRSPSDFDLYVPALMVLAVIMVMFTAAASLIKEVDKGTITRLVLSRMSTFEFLSAVSLNQMLIGTAALALSYLAAQSVGYRIHGSLMLFLAVGAFSVLSVVAISLVVAGFLRTIFELLTVGVFPFFILMFFSESMFPLPKVVFFQMAGHTFYLNDILPTSLTVRAFNKILNFEAGLKEVSFELAGILVLTVLYFALGLWVFRRRHLRSR
ncbi:MAG TPA: ABC transporter permease [Acidobacteriota bacterium]